ncbi:1-acyl-sn-glycerol-3-phosphate acyltransferase alpha-like isoform X2 [Cimex lectularius]|nr:1-acyl-sn-glycerol-3-phosphate acyltransferase alpha-like isoform X2 [Cimex lectularius]XP_014249051.1 1-acyl-sn-glycerol-3-phosphate acyltransferase alpha-like isoform X2 [Cimex lectularius]
MADGLVAGIILVLGAICYNNSRIFRYYTKFAIFILLSLISATIFIPVMLLRPGDYRNALMPAWGARQISKILGLNFEIRGHKNIVQDVGSIVLINHQSCLDLLVLAEIWPVLNRCTVISKREIFYLWPFGLACWLWGTVFINKFSGKHAQETINKAGATIKTRKAKICMFPEGTRHRGESLLPFKKGAFHIAIDCEAPIQPIVVTRYNFLDNATMTFNKGSAVISILPPIETRGLKKENVQSLIDLTYGVMCEEYDKLIKEGSRAN